MSRLYCLAIALALVTLASGVTAQGSIVSGAVGGAAAGAVVAGQQANPQDLPPGLVGKQLRDWVDPATGTTSRFFAGCGVTGELQLSGHGPANYLDVTLINSTNRPISFRPLATRASLNGVERFLTASFGNEIMVQPGWWVRTVHEFPNKGDFSDLDEIVVILGVSGQGEQCEFETTMKRYGEVPRARRTSTKTSSGDLLFEVGSRLRAFGPLSRFGRPYGPGFGMLMGIYGWGHHGLAFDLQLEGYGQTAVDDFADRLDVPDKASFSLASFFLGYVFKYHFHPRFSVHYGLTGGLSVLELTSPEGAVRSKLLFGARHRLRFDFMFAELQDLDFALAPSFYHYVLPNASFAGVEATGNAIGTSLGLLVTN